MDTVSLNKDMKDLQEFFNSSFEKAVEKLQQVTQNQCKLQNDNTFVFLEGTNS